ncbi:unnamed protein product [Cladocopium goreaui]|uniref:Transporter n=1 Tax=Cladocopium goreaui TaxID=2562237 RepID=A0A9P1G665_9DINO|nr:unnamed protein product [Cladocopium goreaui]
MSIQTPKRAAGLGKALPDLGHSLENVDLQQQNQWFEERRRKVDDTNKLLLENEQMQIERLRMAAEDVAAARHRLEQPNEIKKVLVAKRQQMLDRIHVLEEELKHLDDLTEAKDTAAANARIHN